MFHRSTQSTTIFLGNLSILCNETNLYELFSKFGPILSVRLKKCDVDPLRAHLSYGFIDFCSSESVERALVMNNTMFLGRVLRVGRAEDNSTRRNQRKMKEVQETYKPAASASSVSATMTAQVHVMFKVHSLDTIVSEVTLREIFGQMGNLEDVVIKKNVAYDGLGLQSGYGFIHYGLDEKGIESALRAVEMMNHRNVGGVYYECSLTHGLKTYLLSLKKKQSAVAKSITYCSPHFPPVTREALNGPLLERSQPLLNSIGHLSFSSYESLSQPNGNAENHFYKSNSGSVASSEISFQSKTVETMGNSYWQLVDIMDDQY